MEPTGKIIRFPIATELGQNTETAVDQDTVTKALALKANSEDVYNKEEFDAALKELYYRVYQIGMVVWYGEDKNPNVLFPGTVWERIQENALIRTTKKGSGKVNTIVGSDTVTLTAANIPPHSHTGTGKLSDHWFGTFPTSTDGEHVHDYSQHYWPRSWVGPDGKGSQQGLMNTGNAGAHSHAVKLPPHTHTASLSSSGSGGSGKLNVTNAYVKLCGWVRVR